MMDFQSLAPDWNQEPSRNPFRSLRPGLPRGSTSTWTDRSSLEGLGRTDLKKVGPYALPIALSMGAGLLPGVGPLVGGVPATTLFLESAAGPVGEALNQALGITPPDREKIAESWLIPGPIGRKAWVPTWPLKRNPMASAFSRLLERIPRPLLRGLATAAQQVEQSHAPRPGELSPEEEQVFEKWLTENVRDRRRAPGRAEGAPPDFFVAP